MASSNRIELEFGGLFNSLNVNRTPQGRAWSMQNCTVDRGILEVGPRYTLFGRRPGDYGGDYGAGDVGWGLGYGKYSGNEVQVVSLTGTVTGGTVVFKWRPNSAYAYESTAAVPYTVSASGMQDTLENMAFFDVGDVRCTGGPWPYDKIRIEFKKQYANMDVELILLQTNNLQGTNPNVKRYTEIKGGVQEEYVVALQKAGQTTATLYSVNPNTGVYSVMATGMTASPWYFQQYGQRIWALNTADGLNYKTIGGTWNSASAAQTAKPSSPPFKPTANIGGSANAQYLDFSSCTFTACGFGTAAPTIVGGLGYMTMTAAQNITGNALVSVTINFPTPVNLQFNDVLQMGVDCGISTGSDALAWFGAYNESMAASGFSVAQGASGWIIPQYHDNGFNRTGSDGYSFYVRRKHHWSNAYRTQRTAISKLRLEYMVSNIVSGKPIILRLEVGDVWMNDTSALNIADGPVQDSIRYAYSYYNVATDNESDLSPTGTTIPFPTNREWKGALAILSLRGNSALSTTDRLYVYRLEKDTGKWRRLPNVDGTYGITNPGSGNTLYTDRWMEHELKDFPEYGVYSFFGVDSGYAIEALGIFKQCMVIGAAKQAFISYVGQPSVFVDSPDNDNASLPPETRLDRGRTDYVSDTRSEEVNGVHGQDSLYIITPYSSYAMVGDTPADMSPPRRLPGSRGTLGKHSSARLGGGVLCAAEDGVWYYSVGRGFSGEDNGALVAREETQEVRTSYFDRLLDSSTTQGSAVVVCEYLNEVWVFNNQQYMCQTRNGNWIEGTFQHPVRGVVANRTRGLKFMDHEGKLYSLDKTYTTDNGQDVEWSYTTGLLDGPRTRIRHIEVRGTGRPQVKVVVYDGKSPTQTKSFQAEAPDQNFLVPLNLLPGYRYQLTFSGTQADTVEYVAVHVDNAGQGQGN